MSGERVKRFLNFYDECRMQLTSMLPQLKQELNMMQTVIDQASVENKVEYVINIASRLGSILDGDPDGALAAEELASPDVQGVLGELAQYKQGLIEYDNLRKGVQLISSMPSYEVLGGIEEATETAKSLYQVLEGLTYHEWSGEIAQSVLPKIREMIEEYSAWSE